MSELNDVLSDEIRFNILVNCSDSCYKLFMQNVKTHFAKFPNAQVRTLLAPLVNNDLIKIGYPAERKNLLLGQVIRTYDHKVAGVVVNSITHDIDFDGNSLQFSKVIASIYYVLLEYTIRRLFLPDVIRNKVLLQKTQHYFEYILVKNLRLFDLQQNERTLFNFLANVFFYTNYTNMNLNLAYENAIPSGYEDLIKSTIPISKLSKYKTISSLYDALFDFKILSATPNSIKYLLTTNIGLFAFITLHASLSTLISSFIISKYKHSNFASLFISSDMIDGIEKIVVDSYLKKVPYDFDAFNKKIDSIHNRIS